MARWFMGSLSASLAEAAEVPVTVVRIAGSEDETVTCLLYTSRCV